MEKQSHKELFGKEGMYRYQDIPVYGGFSADRRGNLISGK